MAAVAGVVLAKVGEQVAPAAGAGVGIVHHAAEFAQQHLGLFRVTLHLTKAAEFEVVARAVEEERLAVQPVAAGAAGFLVVALDVFGQVYVDDVAHIAFVDAHAKGNGGHHNLHLIFQELLLVRSALFGGHACVVGQGFEALFAQVLGERLGAFAAEAIDDARLAFARFQKGAELVKPVFLRRHPVLDVGAVKAADERARLVHGQLAQNVVAGLLIGGGRECDHGHLRVALFQLTQLHIFRTKVVAPLGDAVRLVNGEQGDLQGVQQAQEGPISRKQTLGGEVEQIQLSGSELVKHQALLIGVQRAVEKGSAYPVQAQGVDLVFHQSDQRGYHNGRALHGERRKLVAQGLSAACRHEHKGVFATEQMFHHRFLGGSKGREPEGLLKQVEVLLRNHGARVRPKFGNSRVETGING